MNNYANTPCSPSRSEIEGQWQQLSEIFEAERESLLHLDAGYAVEEWIESLCEIIAEEEFRERDHWAADDDATQQRIRDYEARAELLHVLDCYYLGPSFSLNIARRKIERGRVRAHRECASEMVSCDDRVSQRDVDSLPADRGHRMRRVAN